MLPAATGIEAPSVETETERARKVGARRAGEHAEDFCAAATLRAIKSHVASKLGGTKREHRQIRFGASARLAEGIDSGNPESFVHGRISFDDTALPRIGGCDREGATPFPIGAIVVGRAAAHTFTTNTREACSTRVVLLTA